MEIQNNVVLVIENHPATLDLITEVLTDAGYVVTGTDSGLGVVALARQLKPRAIVLDLGLPYRSGAALLGDLRADPATAHIPVVVISSLSEALPAARRQLAAAVLHKPFQPSALVDAVRRATQPPRVS